MPKPQKIAAGFYQHEGVTFNVAEVTAMTEAEFVKSHIEQSQAQPAGVFINYADRGDAQEAMLKAAYKAVTDSAPKAEAKAPAKPAKDSETK